MDEELAGRLDELSRALERLERRVESIESKLGSIPPSPLQPARSPLTERSPTDIPFNLALIGRALLALGGAFLLRAITDAGHLPISLGVGLGFAYALSWIGIAIRSASQRREIQAQFHGAVATMIAYPLLWEVTVRFKLFNPPVAAVVWLLLTAFLLAPAARFRFRLLAWVVLGAALATDVALAFATRAILPFASTLLALAVASYWLSLRERWRFYGWPAALVTDLLFLLTVLLVTAERSVHGPGATVVAVLAFIIVFAAIFSLQPLSEEKPEWMFVGAQAVIMLLIAIPALSTLVRMTPAARLPAGLVLLAVGLALYGVLAQTKKVRGTIVIGTMALVLSLAGTAMALGLLLSAVLWVAVSPFFLWLAGARQQPAFSIHAVILAAAATAASGLLWLTVTALVLPKPVAMMPWAPAAVVALATFLLPLPALQLHLRNRTAVVTALLAIAVWNAMGLLAGALILLLDEPVASDTATIRTAVLALSALGMAFVARRGLAPARYLVTPLLVLGGAKLIAEDFRVGNAATLFAGLAIYGGALVAVARLRQGTSSVDTT